MLQFYHKRTIKVKFDIIAHKRFHVNSNPGIKLLKKPVLECTGFFALLPQIYKIIFNAQEHIDDQGNHKKC